MRTLEEPASAGISKGGARPLHVLGGISSRHVGRAAGRLRKWLRLRHFGLIAARRVPSARRLVSKGVYSSEEQVENAGLYPMWNTTNQDSRLTLTKR